jgi:hypothetical protein
MAVMFFFVGSFMFTVLPIASKPSFPFYQVFGFIGEILCIDWRGFRRTRLICGNVGLWDYCIARGLKHRLHRSFNSEYGSLVVQLQITNCSCVMGWCKQLEPLMLRRRSLHQQAWINRAVVLIRDCIYIVGQRNAWTEHHITYAL